MKQRRVAKQGTKELGSYRKNSEISQTTSRTHVKKNPDQAISEFFLIKNLDEESEQFQDKTLQLLVPNSKRLGGYTQ